MRTDDLSQRLKHRNVAASREFHERADPRKAATGDAGVDGDREDAPVLLMTGKVFGEVVSVS
jgi:hypothetical protein